ncbi:N-acetylneuraminate synthase family protein [Cyanobium sp. FACHB-13342]|uniref:N-acetylneuraminate synthase family protein n=1 Tax=Cyanobium sp. FACHB-13342 TaxID=2692793 RepID=UPI001680628A|nr:N-acetylneuraminate synthase family protein [Cyanobium sp. FACHB-13342]MBD2422485.1 N-acetylneuraminate synthase family protein [Cyanobium sp. FACHB-13342]
MTKAPEIIAEAGSNHNGDPDRACALIDLAARVGASSVKFQFILAKGLYLDDFYDGKGYVPNPVFDQRRSEELSEGDWRHIWDHAKAKGIPVSASVFCQEGLALLRRLGAPYVKIASTDLTNHALIEKACTFFDRVIVSTGMATLAEIDTMLRCVRASHPKTDLQLMHCVSAYPCPLEDANTQRLGMLKRAFGLPVGYSDHTGDNISAAMALMQGADFFEKHFTTDQRLPGFDHRHALDGLGLENYVRTLTAATASLSRPANHLSDREQVTRIRARRGVYAARDLPAGHLLRPEDLLFVRPSTEFTVTDPAVLVGKRLEVDVARHAALGPSHAVKVVESRWQAAKDYWGREMSEKGMSMSESAEKAD